MKPVPDLKSLGYVPDFTGQTLENKPWRLRDNLRRTNTVLILAHDLGCGFCADFIAAAADEGEFLEKVCPECGIYQPPPAVGE